MTQKCSNIQVLEWVGQTRQPGFSQNLLRFGISGLEVRTADMEGHGRQSKWLQFGIKCSKTLI